MALTLLLLYGSMGGLAGVLASAVLRPLLLHADSATANKLSFREFVEVATHLMAGAGIAALYWLSWGFAALVAIPWWQRGLAFGAVCWLALAIPVLLGAATHSRLSRARITTLALEWACTCLFAGLACARAWATLP